MDNYTTLIKRAAHERANDGFVSFDTRRELSQYNDFASIERDISYIEEGLIHA